MFLLFYWNCVGGCSQFFGCVCGLFVHLIWRVCGGFCLGACFGGFVVVCYWSLVWLVGLGMCFMFKLLVGLRLRLGGFWVVVLDDVVFGGWVWCVVGDCCSWWLVCLTCVVAVVYRSAWMCFVGLF